MKSWPLLALAVAAFGIGTTEFVIMGLLPDVARDLGVGIPRAGLLVTGYALSVTIGSPVVAVLTMRLERRTTLLGLMGVFVAGNALCAMAPGYATLMAARIVTALAHGAFFGIGSVVATQVVERHRRAQAVAVMFAGLTIANVTGVPLGTLLGQAEGWRATFWAVSAIGVVAAAVLWAAIPSVASDGPVDLGRELRALRRPQVVLAMAMSVLSSVTLFTVFTYVTPMLEGVTGLRPHAVSLVLLAIGVGLTVGNVAGGKLADWRLMPSAIAMFGGLALVMVMMREVLPFGWPTVAVAVLWGAVNCALGPTTQMRVVDQAHDAPNLAATLNQSAFNLGNAVGAVLGGLALSAGWSYRDLPLLAAAVALVGLAVTATSWRLDPARGADAQGGLLLR